MERHHLRGCTERSHHKSLFHLERKCWQDESPRNRGTERTPDISMGFGLECETTVQSASLGMRDKEAINNVTGVPWRMTDGKWTVDRPEVRVDPIPIPPLPFEGARIQRETITRKDIDEFAATIGCQGCNAIKDNKRAQAHSDRCRLRIEGCLRNTPHGAERLDRRNEIINEALADEVRRGEQRKNRSNRTTIAAPGTEPATASATSTATGPTTSPAADPVGENPIEPDVNPKRRLLMKSASLTASGSGQQRQKRSIPDDESRMQVEDTQKTDTGGGEVPPAAESTNIRRRTAVKSEPAAVTTQEAIDGSREKVMRIASVEQVELGNLMELSITGQVLPHLCRPSARKGHEQLTSNCVDRKGNVPRQTGVQVLKVPWQQEKATHNRCSAHRQEAAEASVCPASAPTKGIGYKAQRKGPTRHRSVHAGS